RVGSLHGGPGSLQFHFPIRVPVLRDGATKYVLTAVIAASAIGQLLDDQRLPSGWIAAILDAKGTIVARTTALDRIVGQPAGTRTPPRDFPGRSTWIRRDMGGQPGYVTYARSPQSDWTVAIALPATIVDGPLHHSLWSVVAAGLLFTGIGALAAGLVG